MEDDEIIRILDEVRGIGPWTVQMLLIFTLGRPNVFPVDDLGIQLAIKKLYGLRTSGPRLRKRMQAIAETWRPHRTLACRYLWRSRPG